MVEERRKSVTDLDQTLVREIYAPLAHRLGMAAIRWELEPGGMENLGALPSLRR